MVGRIFHLNDQGEATPMKETDYDAESTLQELLAKHPDLLAGDQIDSDEPRRWLLVTREMAVASEDGDVERWSLDHLFLDQDAIPTLVEVKRSTNTDIRRKVVGQLLDYARSGRSGREGESCATELLEKTLSDWGETNDNRVAKCFLWGHNDA